MSQSANVKSIQAIRDFKVALANFADDARNALSSTDMEVRRIRNWLTRDQMSYWQAQIKRRNEELSNARTELHRRRLSQQGSDAVSDTDQKEAMRLAQRRLQEAELKLATVKRWVPILEHAISEYRAASQPLGDRLSGQLVHSLAMLERMANMLDQYIATQAVATEVSMGGYTPGSEVGSAATKGSTAQPVPDGEAAESAETAPAEAKASDGGANGKAGSPAETETETEEEVEAVHSEPSRGSRP